MGRSQEAVESFQKATMSVADAQLDEKGKQDAVFSFGKQIKQIKDGNMKIRFTQPELELKKDKLPDDNWENKSEVQMHIHRVQNGR